MQSAFFAHLHIEIREALPDLQANTCFELITWAMSLNFDLQNLMIFQW